MRLLVLLMDLQEKYRKSFIRNNRVKKRKYQASQMPSSKEPHLAR